MKIHILLLVSVIAVMGEDNAQLQLTEANKKFAQKMFDSLSKEEGNVFFSPLSVHAVLSMLYQGAAGSTEQALATGLEVRDPSLTAEGYNKIITDINNIQNVTLFVKNKIYIKEGWKLKKPFDTAIQEKFLSKVDGIDFVDNEAAAGTINNWVSEQTHGKITNLFQADDFDQYTRIVLLNAIYFKGIWSTPFYKEMTRTEPFFVDGPNNKIDCQMMHRTGGFNFKNDENLKAKVVEIPFTNQGVSLIVALPTQDSNIGALQASVKEKGVDSLIQGLSWYGDVILALPKFKIETEMNLNKPLTDMGLGVLFDERHSNLSKIIDNGDEVVDLYVSKAIQKAYIEVNEEGAEAAAVTGFVGAVAVSLPVYEEVYINRPFLVVLKEGSNILFYGRIVKPTYTATDKAPRSPPSYYDAPVYIRNGPRRKLV